MRHSLTLFLVVLLISHLPAQGDISPEDVRSVLKISGLEFSEQEIDSMLENVREYRYDYNDNRSVTLSNDIAPAFFFSPLPAGYAIPEGDDRLTVEEVAIQRPENSDELAFLSIPELAHLLRTQKVTSEELTAFFLDRLRAFDPGLHCVISFMDERALQQARAMDKEIESGNYRGLLHGIPYGLKDLFAARGARTTWGAAPYSDQLLDYDATVATRLEEAGAVLVAKLTLGALAWGDVWFGGKTRNPWDTTRGSSGSSAGSASAVAAGLVPFAIGTETLGSIVSPSTVCGTTGLRPTFGRVSRFGAMALSWTMDKVGPICRSAEDCAIVFAAIEGEDPRDPSTTDARFIYDSSDEPRGLRIGYVPELFAADYPFRATDSASLEVIRELGYELVPVELPDYPDITFILNVEAAAAFDELTRSNRDDELVRQIRNAWPNAFRAARTIPAVEYVQAMRLRTILIDRMQAVFEDVDILVHPSWHGPMLRISNMTGHPCAVVPNGFRDGRPASISFTGKLFDEATLLHVAHAFQEATAWNKSHPPGY